MPQSLQDSLSDPSHTKAVIQASLKSADGLKRVWCVVESDDDVEVFDRFFLNPDVSVLPSTNEIGKRSCQNVESIVMELYAEEESPRVFGIRDRDYTCFSDSYIKPDNVFLTDGRDLEMMMLKSSSVIEGLRAWNQNFPDIVNQSAETMRFLGYLRIFNDLKQTSCIFKDNLTKVSVIWDDSSHSVYADYSDRLFSKFQDSIENQVTRTEFDQFVADNELKGKSIYDVCRGHDVCRLACVMMVKKEFSRTRDLFNCMKNSYSFDDFKGTSLYHDILDWADHRNLIIFP